MGEANITQIAVAGGSGRVPTGALQFRDDWPGLFLRGDDAIAVMVSIRRPAERLGDNPDVGIASALSRLNRVADIIERDVVVRRAGG
jgi:hypothetical protein